MFNYLLKRLYLVVYPCKQRNLKIFKKGRVFVMNLSLVIITLVVLATFMIMAAVTDAVQHFQNRKKPSYDRPTDFQPNGYGSWS